MDHSIYASPSFTLSASKTSSPDRSSLQLLVSCIAIILMVSVYDTYLVYLFRESIELDERNPICLALINRDPIGLNWFYLGKALGNATVVSVLAILYRFRFRHHSLVALGVAGFQIMLTVYLGFADHLSGFMCFDGLWSENMRVYNRTFNSLMIQLAVLSSVILIFAAVFIRRQHGSRQERMVVHERAC